jgi:hypothetical protein
MTAQTAADLRAAADVLRRDGWTQGAYHCEGSHCAVGAIEMSTGVWVKGQYRNYAEPRVTEAWRALMKHLGHDEPNAIFAFNDAPGRTADEVIAALEAAAQAAEAKA